MIIIKEQIEYNTPFKDILDGGCFFHKGFLFLRLDNSAIQLGGDGEPKYLSNDAPCQPVIKMVGYV